MCSYVECDCDALCDVLALQVRQCSPSLAEQLTGQAPIVLSLDWLQSVCNARQSGYSHLRGISRLGMTSARDLRFVSHAPSLFLAVDRPSHRTIMRDQCVQH